MKLDYLPSFFTLFYSLPSKGSISELSGLVLKQTPVSGTFVTQTLPISCEAWVSCGSESRNGTGEMGGQRGGTYRVITINLSMRFRANKKIVVSIRIRIGKKSEIKPPIFFPEKKNTDTCCFHRESFFKIPVCCWATASTHFCSLNRGDKHLSVCYSGGKIFAVLLGYMCCV